MFSFTTITTIIPNNNNVHDLRANDLNLKQITFFYCFQTIARLKKERLVRTALVSIPCAIAMTAMVDAHVKFQVLITLRYRLFSGASIKARTRRTDANKHINVHTL